MYGYDYDSWLARQVEEYMKECEPEYDADGDAPNCLECDNEDCEYWADWHNKEEKKEC